MGNTEQIHQAFVDGDVSTIRLALGSPPDFPSTKGPDWLGDVLTYAIYWSPIETVRELLALGADANVDTGDGFPPLIAATDRQPRHGTDDRCEVIELLLEHGADPNVRGMNDGTPLHQAVWKHATWPSHRRAVGLLLGHGADPNLATRIDDCSTPAQDAAAMGAAELAQLIRESAQN